MKKSMFLNIFKNVTIEYFLMNYVQKKHHMSVFILIIPLAESAVPCSSEQHIEAVFKR